MGGNIWKNQSKRLNKEEYLSLETEVLEKLHYEYGDVKMETIKAYRTKESFGDMDVVVCAGKFSPTTLCKLFDIPPEHTSSNGNSLSFLYKEFQIDLIFTNEKDYVTSLNYYAWNVLGNLIGRVSRKLGLKYGHDGLSVRMMEGTDVILEKEISRDTEKILTFLGYDYKTFEAGFDTLEDIFKFAASSMYFNKEIFAFENRNHHDRLRDRKRPVYNAFLEWCDEAEGLPAFSWADMDNRGYKNNGGKYYPAVDKFFGTSLVQTYQEALKHQSDKRALAEVFNGNLVSEWTGLTGKDLGAVMKAYNSEYDLEWKIEHFVYLTYNPKSEFMLWFDNEFVLQ